jgi:hypothetical protein
MRTIAKDLILTYAARVGSRVRPRDTQQHWIRATKEILTAFAAERGWQSVCTGVRNHEFLLDFIAVNPETSDVQIAVESEWGHLGAVVYDFRKLLYIKSDVKIMICGPGDDRLCSRLEEVATRYPRHLAGETYIVQDVSEAARCIRSYIWTAPSDGPAQVRFQPFMDAVPFAFASTAAS